MADPWMTPDQVADWIKMEKAKKDKGLGGKTPEEPAYSSLDLAVIGEAVRFELPFAVMPSRFRKYAELLRGFAEDLDFLSRELPALSDKDYARKRRSIVFELKERAKVLRQRIKEAGE